MTAVRMENGGPWWGHLELTDADGSEARRRCPRGGWEYGDSQLDFLD